MGAAALATAQSPSQTCTPVGGILFTNVAAIENRINFGVVYGDLAGASPRPSSPGPKPLDSRLKEGNRSASRSNTTG